MKNKTRVQYLNTLFWTFEKRNFGNLLVLTKKGIVCFVIFLTYIYSIIVFWKTYFVYSYLKLLCTEVSVLIIQDNLVALSNTNN